jgi:hypothetical protein
MQQCAASSACNGRKVNCHRQWVEVKVKGTVYAHQRGKQLCHSDTFNDMKSELPQPMGAARHPLRLAAPR